MVQNKMSMAEKVAQAMAEQDQLGATADGPQINRGGWRAYLPMARAAIEAMREPSEEMLHAPKNMEGRFDLIGDTWCAMIDAAMSET